jgi:hypothetical protein
LRRVKLYLIVKRNLVTESFIRSEPMKNWQYTLYLFVLGIISFITREVVTFIMLGIILITLNNIHTTLKEVVKSQKKPE